MEKDTLFVHAGTEPDPTTGAIMTPVYFTSTYVQEEPGKHKGYEYSRTANPTRTALENAIAQLEYAKYGLAFASGMAATDAILKLLKPNDKILTSYDVYGGTFRIFDKVYKKFNISFDFVDFQDLQAVKNKLNENSYSLIWLETPTNPLLKIYDIKAIAELKKDAILVTDNTFASPFLQNPLLLGADIVVHSATKYLGGHSDVVLGAIALNDEKIAEELYFIQNSTGGVAGPMDAYLVLRGIKTLHVRMEKHCYNASKLAEFLLQHPKVKKVYYPGLPKHPNHEIAKKQMKDFGGMISFELNSDKLEDAFKFMKSVKIFSLAESLGGVESLISHPASMTHAAIPEEERLKAGISNTLIRLSVGIEHIEDIIKDVERGLESVN